MRLALIAKLCYCQKRNGYKDGAAFACWYHQATSGGCKCLTLGQLELSATEPPILLNWTIDLPAVATVSNYQLETALETLLDNLGVPVGPTEARSGHHVINWISLQAQSLRIRNMQDCYAKQFASSKAANVRCAAGACYVSGQRKSMCVQSYLLPLLVTSMFNTIL